MTARTFKIGRDPGSKGAWQVRLTTAQFVVSLVLSLASLIGGAVTMARTLAEPMVEKVVEETLLDKGLATNNALELHLAVDKVEKKNMLELLQRIDSRLERIETRLESR